MGRGSLRGSRVGGGRMNIKRCPAFNCGYVVSSMPEYKFCPMCGTLLQEPKKTLWEKRNPNKMTNIYDFYKEDVKDALNEFIKGLHQSLYINQSEHNIINNKAKEIFGEELVGAVWRIKNND
jgi:hypothetical protein